MTIRKTFEQIQAAASSGGIEWMQLREIEKHPEGFTGWERDDVTRIEANNKYRKPTISSMIADVRSKTA